LDVRQSRHPGQYIQPGSLKPKVVEQSLVELQYASHILGGREADVIVEAKGREHALISVGVKF
jgi:UV DNA damage repair endonuclease